MNRKNHSQGSEDTTQNRQNIANVKEGHDALEEQARRVEATAPASTDHPIEGMGDRATGSEDTSENRRNLRQVEENTRAAKEQAQRVDESASGGIKIAGPTY